MKKTMLFIVSMLFAVGVNAATVTMTGPAGSVPGATPSTFQVALASGVEDVFAVQFDEETQAQFTFTFNPDSAPLSTVGFYADNVLVGSIFTAIQGENASTLSFIQSLAFGVTYTLKAIAESGSLITATVSAVPVPAALFLFAPALLGFLSLRRKAISTSVVAA